MNEDLRRDLEASVDGEVRFDTLTRLPSMSERYRVRPLAIAGYPMYRGLARLVGMEVHEGSSDPIRQVEIAAENWDAFDFFYIHVKDTDRCGENGDFDGKRDAIERVDAAVPRLADLLFGAESGDRSNVLVVTGDHSTPVSLKAHSWHPVPVFLSSPACRPDDRRVFGETACASGGLGRLPMVATRFLLEAAVAPWFGAIGILLTVAIVRSRGGWRIPAASWPLVTSVLMLAAYCVPFLVIPDYENNLDWAAGRLVLQIIPLATWSLVVTLFGNHRSDTDPGDESMDPLAGDRARVGGE